MKIIVGSSGASLIIDILPDQTGEELKQKLAMETSITMKNQILFTNDGVRIRSDKIPLKHYDPQLFLKNSIMVKKIKKKSQIYSSDNNNNNDSNNDNDNDNNNNNSNSNKKRKKSQECLEVILEDSSYPEENKYIAEKIEEKVKEKKDNNNDNNNNNNNDEEKEIEQTCVYLFDREYIRHPTTTRNDIINIENYRRNEPSLNEMKTIKKGEFTAAMADLNQHPLSNSSSILIKMLPHFEVQFQYDWFISQFYIHQNQERIYTCQECLKKLKYQHNSLKVLDKYLISLSDKMNTAMKEYIKQFQTQSSEHEPLLQEFESDLEKLGDVQLHPALQTPSKKTLLDCVPEKSLREWHARCKQSHEKLTSKVTSLKEEKQSIDKKYQTITETVARVPFSFTDLSSEIHTCETKIKDMQQIEKILLQDLQQVQGTIANAVNELQNSNGLSVEISHSPTKFNQTHDQHVKILLPKLRALDSEIFNVLTQFQEAQSLMLDLFANSVSLVADLQKSLMDESNKLAALSESLSRKQELFDQLLKVKRLPQSYVGCLEEVVRCRAFGQVMSKELSRIGDVFNKFREQENNRRLEFLHQHGWNLPSDLVPGLGNKPGICELKYHHIEEILPSINSFEVNNNNNNNNNEIHDNISTLENLAQQFQQSLHAELSKEKELDLNTNLRITTILKEKENEKTIALEQQKKEYENELQTWKMQYKDIIKERDDLKQRLDNNLLLEIPISKQSSDLISNPRDNPEDFSIEILEKQLSRILENSRDSVTLNRVSQCFSRAININNYNSNNSMDNKDIKLTSEKLSTEMEMKIEKMQTEISRIKKENEMIIERMGQLTRENNNLQQELMEMEPLREQVKEFQLCFSNLHSEIQRFRQMEQEFLLEKRRLLFTIKELTEDNDKLQKDITNIKDQKKQIEEKPLTFSLSTDNSNQKKQMENLIKNWKSSRIRFDKDFDCGDLLLFQRITLEATESKERGNHRLRKPTYLAFIHDSSIPCFLELDNEQIVINTPKWIVGEVISKESHVMMNSIPGLPRGSQVTRVFVDNIREVSLIDPVFNNMLNERTA